MEETTAQNKQSDWNITELYSQAFKIVKKNKVLWLFGLAISGGLGSGFNWKTGNFSSLQQLFQNSPKEQSNLFFSNVLGTASSSPFQDAVKFAFNSIPFYLYLLLFLSVLVGVIGVLIISIVFQAWAKAALVVGTDLSYKKHQISIEKVSTEALPRIKSVIWLDIIPSLILLLILALISALLVFCFSSQAIILGVLISLVGFGFFIYSLIKISLTQIWALREAVLNNLSGFQSFKSGWNLTKGRFWKMLLLGTINNILAGIVVALPVGLVIGLLVAFGIAGLGENKSMLPGLIGLILVLGLIIYLALNLLAGIIQAFKAVVWTMAYRQLNRHD